MLDKTASSTITVLPLHIAKTALELLIVGILGPGSHQIPIRILLTQPPCVPVDQLLGTVARHPARETTSEISAGLRTTQCLNSTGSACPVALGHRGCIRAGDAQRTSLGSPGQVLPLYQRGSVTWAWPL